MLKKISLGVNHDEKIPLYSLATAAGEVVEQVFFASVFYLQAAKPYTLTGSYLQADWRMYTFFNYDCQTCLRQNDRGSRHRNNLFLQYLCS